MVLTNINLKESESITQTRKVSFQQQEVTVKTASSEQMSTATASIQETHSQEQSESMQTGDVTIIHKTILNDISIRICSSL